MHPHVIFETGFLSSAGFCRISKMCNLRNIKKNHESSARFYRILNCSPFIWDVNYRLTKMQGEDNKGADLTDHLSKSDALLTGLSSLPFTNNSECWLLELYRLSTDIERVPVLFRVNDRASLLTPTSPAARMFGRERRSSGVLTCFSIFLKRLISSTMSNLLFRLMTFFDVFAKH